MGEVGRNRGRSGRFRTILAESASHYAIIARDGATSLRNWPKSPQSGRIHSSIGRHRAKLADFARNWPTYQNWRRLSLGQSLTDELNCSPVKSCVAGAPLTFYPVNMFVGATRGAKGKSDPAVNPPPSSAPESGPITVIRCELMASSPGHRYCRTCSFVSEFAGSADGECQTSVKLVSNECRVIVEVVSK